VHAADQHRTEAGGAERMREGRDVGGKGSAAAGLALRRQLPEEEPRSARVLIGLQRPQR
jgi:hypothetical protein